MQTLTLLHSESFPIGRYADALRRESISAGPMRNLDQLSSGEGSSLRVALVDAGINNGRHSALALDPRTAIVGIGLDEQPKWLADDSIFLNLPQDPSTTVLVDAI